MLNIYLITSWSRVLLQKLTGFQPVKKFPHFMEPEVSLQHSQVPATCPYLQSILEGPRLNLQKIRNSIIFTVRNC